MNSLDFSDLIDMDDDLANTIVTRADASAGCEQPATRAAGASAPALLARAPFPDISPALPAFGPSFEVGGALPDIQFVTVDNGRFYAHRGLLRYVSSDAFGGLLAGRDESIHVPEASAIFAIALHVAYGLSCAHLTNITLETIESAVNVLSKYGIPPQSFAAPNMPLFQLILSQASYYPIDAYALAAHYGFQDLAVAVSSHLLAYDLSGLTDELCVKMGAVHIKLLFDLHQTRRNALKNIVMNPPKMHQPHLACGTREQQDLTLAWAFAAAEMAWNAPSSTSTYMMQSTFERAATDISCGECRTMLKTRIQEAMEEWSAVPRTI
ncbi:hypothetical protein K466DRAFT_664665 [Polyporus arcularius HHB13444]|uniref:BTB domain-containing protein n=1 Tax=Polyporus arcularius HHB13444 TaxID=1314778 RepID=A0A5C3PH20_9APHY|nr:hypothetical protein K466DRAFT_664665 [Polyporus arcularius HHB13444]